MSYAKFETLYTYIMCAFMKIIYTYIILINALLYIYIIALFILHLISPSLIYLHIATNILLL